MKEFTNLAQLRLAKLRAGQTIYVKGHTTEGDGGGGDFWLDTSDTTTADDGVYNIVDAQSPRTGTWKRLLPGKESPVLKSTVADLRANTKAELLRASIAAHTTQGDGGFGELRFDASDTTTADDNGLNIVDSQSPRTGTWKRLITGESVHAVDFGVTVGGATDNSTALAASLATGKNVFLPPGSIRLDSPVSVSVGQSLTGAGSAPDSLTTNATIITTALDISPIQINGKNTKIGGFSVVNTGTSTLPAIDCQDNVAYFNIFGDITTHGFKYGIQGERCLYHTHYDCHYDDCEIGANYIGAAGSWNIDWFNNVITFINPTFRRNSVKGLYAKGVCVAFIGAPDFSSCPIGCEIVGESGSARSFSSIIENPYVENTNNPFKFTNATVNIIGGFAQGFGSPVAGDNVIVADNSQVKITGKLDGQSLWDKWAVLTNGAELILETDELEGVSGRLSQKVSWDSTSTLRIMSPRAEGETASLAPSGTEDLFTPSIDGTFLVTASGISFANHFWSGVVQKAGGSSTLNITAFQSNRTSMTDNAGALRITNTDAGQSTAYTWSYMKLGGR